MFQFASTPTTLSRRDALRLSTCGFGYLAFAGLTTEAVASERTNPLARKEPHFPAKAKRVIFLCMSGGPSHVDMFDHKPKLKADNGKLPPAGTGRGFGVSTLLGSPFTFKKMGKSGMWMSELFPNLGKQADEICMLNGLHTNVPAHPQAFLQLHTGSSQFVRPSLGAWTLYGLGSENQNLPGFVSINPPTLNGGVQNYGSAFLPAIMQGTKLNTGGSDGAKSNNLGIANIANTKMSSEGQRAQLDFIQTLNEEKLKKDKENAQIEGVIESYELGFRMQKDVPNIMDISKETRETQSMYGIGEIATDSFGRQCLLACRLVEAGVRFVEVTAGDWDHHQDLKTSLSRTCTSIDKPIAALLIDLKQRGLLKDTLVVWCGEFGRTPSAQGGDGRDHNNKGFSGWLAGGGVKAGFTYGKTDEYGFEAIEGKIHTHDFHATILHLLGLDHEKLTYRYAGRDFRLTDVHGVVAKDILG